MFGKKKSDDLGQNIDEETMEYHDDSSIVKGQTKGWFY